MLENRQGVRSALASKWPELLALIVFMVAFCFVSAAHEPWFDEAQAWQIAKCASYSDILFTIPHYEGHPPLWHLLLSIPAKLGAPFELGLKSVGFICSCANAILLLFFSKMPRPLRIALLFSYFFFYQYGVVVRPYSLMILAFLCIGMLLPKRNEHPWAVVGSLTFLCLTSAYGLLMAGGIALCITWDLAREKGFKKLILEVLVDARTQSLLVLLVIAILIVICIRPSSDALGMNLESNTPLVVRLLCALLTFPTECFLTTTSWFGIEQVSMQLANISWGEAVVQYFIGIVFWTLAICAGSKRNAKYLLVPFALFCIFSAAIYFSTHHMGIVFMLFLFWTELTSRDDNRFEIGETVLSRIATNEKDRNLGHRAYRIFVACCLLIPLYWCVKAAINDIKYPYCYGREAATFLKDAELSNKLVLSDWISDSIYEKDASANEQYINTSLATTGVVVNAYYQNNVFFNINNGNGDEAFTYHRVVTCDESAQATARWRSEGIPDVIIGKPDLENVYGDSLSYDDYTLVALCESRFIWKTGMSRGQVPIYLRTDLLDACQLKPIEDKHFALMVEGIDISDEMKEGFENGIPVEELLRPYFE